MVEESTTGKRASLALISPVVPYPADSGTRRRVFHIVKFLKEEFLLTVGAFVHTESERDDLVTFGNRFDVTTIPLQFPQMTESRVVSLLRRILRLVTGRSPVCLQPRVLQQIRDLFDTGRFEYTLGVQTSVAAYLAGLGKTIPSQVILDEACLYHLFYQRIRENIPRSRPCARTIASIRYRRLKRLEIRLLERFRRVTAVSKWEADLLGTMSECAEILLVPNGVDTDRFRAQPLVTTGFDLLFTGDLGYRPNYDAIQWFGKMVLPELRKIIPAARLVHIGKGDELLKGIPNRWRNGVVSMGYQEDIVEALWRGTVFVNPMWEGAGTRLKVLEAMALGKVVISTEIGAEGIVHADGVNILIANDQPSFVEQLKRIYEDLILGDGTMAAKISQEAVATIHRLYEWERCIEPLKLFIKGSRVSDEKNQ